MIRAGATSGPMRRLLFVGICLTLAALLGWIAMPHSGDERPLERGAASIAPPAPSEVETPVAQAGRTTVVAPEAAPTAPPVAQDPATARTWRLRVSVRDVVESWPHAVFGWSSCQASVIATPYPVLSAYVRELPRDGYRHGAVVWTSEDGPQGELLVLGEQSLYATLIMG